MPGNITITTTPQQRFHFMYRTQEGESILTGEPRPSKDRALEDAAALRRCVLEDGSYAVSRDPKGHFFFHLIGERGEVLGVSPTYSTPEGLGKAIAILKACVPLAEVVDNT